MKIPDCGRTVRLSPLVGWMLLSLFIGCDQTGGDANTPSKTVLHVWAHHGQPDEKAALQGVLDAFNEAHDELEAHVTFFPDNQYPDKVSIANFGGDLPDIVEVDGPFVGIWAAEGILEPLDRFITPELRDDFLPSVLEQGTFEDRLYALGAFESALVVYYDKDIIDKAGLQPPTHVDEAWTWDEFLAALEKVKPHCDLPLALHMDAQSDEWFTYAFSPLVWSNGGRLVAPDSCDADGVLDGKATIEAIKRWKTLFEKGYAQPTSTNPNPFGAGLAAFDWNGHWMLSSFRSNEDLNFSAMPLPQLGEQHVAPSGSWCWGITRSADDPEAAWRLVRWILHPEQGVKPLVEANSAVPARRSAFRFFPRFEQMPSRLFREQLEKSAHPRPRTPIYLTVTREFARALRDIAKEADPKQSLQDAADAVQRACNRYHRRAAAITTQSTTQPSESESP